MKGAIALVKKEMRCYFCSPVAYVIIGLFQLVMGIIFAKFVDIYMRYNTAQRFGAAPQGITLDKLAMYFYQNMAFFLVIFTPLITMRLFAEEKRQQTLELLFTAPIREFELVLGKFFAGYLLSVVMIALSLIYVLFMVMWGNPEVGIIVSTYIGLLLSMACYISLGTLISAMTSSQAIAAVWTFIVLLLLWLLQSLGQGVTAATGFIKWGAVMVNVSPLGHMTNFAEGVIHVKDVIYFFSFIGLMLFLTHRVIESNRWR